MEFIRRHFRALSLLALLFVLIVTGLSAWEARKLRFDYDFETFFPVDDPDLDVYKDFRKTFEYDNEFVLLALIREEGIFEQKFLQNVSLLTDSLRHVKDVTAVRSPADASYFTTTGEYPYLHIDNPAAYHDDSVQVYRSEEMVGSLFATDAKSVCLYIKTTDGISKNASDSLLQHILSGTDHFGFSNYKLAGKLNGQKIYLDRLRNEFFVFFIASFLLVVTFLYISFRSAWGVWVPVMIVLLSILWTLALMAFTGKTLDIMTVLLPTMMFVVGMSDVVHIVTKYLEELRDGNTNRFDALLKTIKDVGFATFITLITTALGFLTLINSKIIPIRDFGIYTSIGVFVAFVLSFTIMPLVLNVLPQPNLKLERKGSQFWNKRLHRLLGWIFRNGKGITIGAILLVILSGIGISRLRLNNYLIEGLTTRDQLRQDVFFFEEKYSGIRPFEIVIHPADSTRYVFGNEELIATDKLEHYLKETYGVGFIFSPASVVRSANKALHDASPDYYTLPSDTSEISAIIHEMVRRKQSGEFVFRNKELNRLISKDGKTGRITGKMHDIGSFRIREKNHALEKFIAETPELKNIRVKITGAAVMLDKNNEYLVANTIQGLFISILVVAIIISLIHRSWRLAVIALVPNLLPIIFIGGLMGYCGIELKSSTSIIFSIAFGIATDDTVHFLGRLKLEMKQGLSVLYAVKRTFLSTGKAVVVTSLILSAGFMTLIGSGFESTFYFGMLVSITLIVAVLTDLLLFPLLVIWLVRKK